MLYLYKFTIFEIASNQQGTYAPADFNNRWMGSAAIDRDGNLALGFSVSSSTTYPSIRYAGRLSTDPPGTLAQDAAVLQNGNGSQTSSSGRWGDYSMLAVDPVDDCTFWYTTEYYSAFSSSGWQTRIGKFSFPTCTGSNPSPTPTPNPTPAPTPTTTNCVGPGLFSISGNVRVFGAIINLSGPNGWASATTSTRFGTYQFQNLANGIYTVTPTKTGCTFSPSSQTVTISGSNKTANFSGTCSP